MKILNRIVLLMVGVVAPQISFATDGISCGGTVSTIGVHSIDRVMLRLSGMNAVVQICNLNQSLGANNAVTAQQCKAAYSTLLMAHAMGKSIKHLF